jgi:2-(3-amino-3-carboxypropyl)histidine synthase
MKSYDFEEERVKHEILKSKAKRVLLQLPEGLKPEAPRLAKLVEKSGALPIISANPCYGACDLATEEAESLGIDLIIHYGHSKLVRHEPIPTIYVEARATVDVSAAVEKAVPLLDDWQKIGLTTTVQHVQTLDSAREILVLAEKTVYIGDTGRLKYPGQVIGCDYSNAKSIEKDIEAFLFIGGGRFHALGVALSTMKLTIVADPYKCEAFSIGKEADNIVRQRWGRIQEAQKMKSFGILVGLKPGQKSLERALQIRQKLEKSGKDAYIFAVEEVTPEALLEFPTIEAYVNTACPRLSVDDGLRFNIPVLSKNEALVVIGDMSWEELCKRGLFED